MGDPYNIWASTGAGKSWLIRTLGFQHDVIEFRVHILNCLLNVSTRLIKRSLILHISKLESQSSPGRGLNGAPPQRYFYLESVNMTLFEKKGLCRCTLRILR